MESGHEFTRKRLVEMEATLEREVARKGDAVLSEHSEGAEKLMAAMRGEPRGRDEIE